MHEETRSRVTAILVERTGDVGDRGPGAEELFPLVYDELRRLARGFMGRERREHTLQPTALVHEAFIKLVDQSRVDWQGQSHFRAVGAKVMRRILVDHARQHASAKRGGDRRRVTLGPSVGGSAEPDLDLEELLDLNQALDRLGELDERQARVVELRFFAGMTTSEAAAVLGVSERTVEGDWTHARAWLRRELSKGGKA